MPLFSVIIPTRNRSELFRRALDSVLRQSCSDLEVIVINDGSAGEQERAYALIAGATDPGRVRWLSLVPRPNGHGQSYALNIGVAEVTSSYVCFLDDDDWWLDEDHLARAQGMIENTPSPIDIYMTNQVAFFRGQERQGPIWLEDLREILVQSGNLPNENGVHDVTVDELLRSRGFCHLNTLIVRRGLYQEIGGMDETIRWECDRDLFLRLIDRAITMKYAPVIVSRHNIPDPAKASNMTTAISEFEKRLFQVRVLDRAALLAQHPAIRAHGRRHKAYALKKLAESLDRAGLHSAAAFYAREALGTGPTVKWAAYTAWLAVRALLGTESRHEGPSTTPLRP